MKLTIKLFQILLFFFSAFCIADDTTVYLQSKVSQLKKEANNASANIVEVHRGDTFKILKTEGLWLQVEFNKNVGWISKILTSKSKPIGEADLLKDYGNSQSKEKSARKRSSEYAVSAATRGLTATERNRNNINKSRSNREALKDLDEDAKVSPDEVDEFVKKGSLNEK